MSNRTVSESLDLAADIIERRGWAVGSGQFRPEYQDNPWQFHSATAPVCIEGALLALEPERYKSAYEMAMGCPVYAAVADYVGMTGRGRLYSWNDELGRTASEVIAVLRAAAAVERVKEETRELVDA